MKNFYKKDSCHFLGNNVWGCNLIITIVIPVYNCEKYIAETLNSVFACTTDFEFECIVVDDGSTDNTALILDSYKNRIKLLKQNNLGESSAVNAALKVASGKYCLILSADDPLLSSQLFRTSFNILEKDNKVVATYPDWIMIDSKGKKLKEIKVQEYSRNVMFKEFKCIPGPGAIFRTSIANKIGGRDIRYKLVGDFDFWLRLSSEGVMVRIPNILASWRFHKGSATVMNKNYQTSMEYIAMARNLLASNISMPQENIRPFLANAYFKGALLSFYSLDVPGRSLLFKAFKANRFYLPGAKISQILFLLFLPLSYQLRKFLKKVH